MEKNVNIRLREHFIENITETDFPHTYGDNDEEWSHKRFRKSFRVNMVKLDKMEMEVDLIGINCSVANAIRRILLSEVPSMAIERVFISNNTTLIKDEILAHRLGLVPLKANHNLFDFPTGTSDESNQGTTLVFELKAKCVINSDGNKNSCDPNEKYKNYSIFSKHLRWVPLGGQASIVSEKQVGPVYSDILLNKMRPGQELDIKMHAVKGIGKDHAKFSPVATAFYRMLPKIELLRPVTGEAAHRLQKCFSPGVIGIEKAPNGEPTAVVLDARHDTCSRNVFRYDDLKNAVVIDRVRNHFIFHVESVGALTPDVLFLEAINVLRKKCSTLLEELETA